MSEMRITRRMGIDEEEKLKKINPKIASSHKHPPYFEMIKEALVSLGERKGSSADDIAKFIEEKYNSSNLPSNFRKLLSVQLKNCVAKYKLQKTKGSSYTLLSPSDSVQENMKEIEKEGIEGILRLKTYLKFPTSKNPERFINSLVLAPVLFIHRRGNIQNVEQLEDMIEKEEDLEKKKKYQEWLPKAKKGTEAWEKYSTQLTESQGFDFDEFPRVMPTFPWCEPVAEICPLSHLDETNVDLISVCHKALDDFNTLNATPFKFVKVVKANLTTFPSRRVFYATFQATLPFSHPPRYLYTFQARVDRARYNNCTTDFCRLKKDASGNLVVSKMDDEGTKPADAGVDVDVQGQWDVGPVVLWDVDVQGQSDFDEDDVDDILGQWDVPPSDESHE